MKNTTTILLSGLLLCGCSQKQVTSTSPPADFVQAGKDIKVLGGWILHVDKRDGGSVTGIRLVLGPGTSSEAVYTADTGTITPEGSLNGEVVVMKLVLHNWKDKNGAHDGQDTTFAIHK